MKVLFVCKSNVGRSQMAETIFNQLAGGKHTALSAGIEAIGSEGLDLNGISLKDRASSKYVLECLKEVGIDASNNSIKRLTPAMVKNSDQIFVMTSPDMTPDFLKNNKNIIYWKIEDPDGQTLEAHRKTRDQIAGLIKSYLGSLNRSY